MTLFRIKKRKVQKPKKNKINLTIDAKHNETLKVFNKKKRKDRKI